MMRNILESDPTAAPGFSYLANDRLCPRLCENVKMAAWNRF